MFVSYERNFAITLLIAFVAAFLFCIWSVNAMAMDKPMNDCATQQGHVAFCNVGPQGHFLIWKILPATPQKALALLFLGLLFVIGFSIGRRWPDPPPIIRRYLNIIVRERISIVDPIRHALSRGIIQPHIYERV